MSHQTIDKGSADPHIFRPGPSDAYAVFDHEGLNPVRAAISRGLPPNLTELSFSPTECAPKLCRPRFCRLGAGVYDLPLDFVGWWRVGSCLETNCELLWQRAPRKAPQFSCGMQLPAHRPR